MANYHGHRIPFWRSVSRILPPLSRVCGRCIGRGDRTPGLGRVFEANRCTWIRRVVGHHDAASSHRTVRFRKAAGRESSIPCIGPMTRIRTTWDRLWPTLGSQREVSRAGRSRIGPVRRGRSGGARPAHVPLHLPRNEACFRFPSTLPFAWRFAPRKCRFRAFVSVGIDALLERGALPSGHSNAVHGSLGENRSIRSIPWCPFSDVDVVSGGGRGC